MLKRKKLLILISSFIVFIIVILLLITLFFITRDDRQVNKKIRQNTEFTNSLNQFINNDLGVKKTPDKITELVSIINDSSLSDEEKYKALSDFEYYLSGTYVVKHDPKVREFAVNVLDPYATKNFPEFHTEGLFIFPCSDTTCGQELTKELVEISQIIQNSTLSDADKNAIGTNLITVGQAPDNDKNEKVYGYGIVYDQLITASNNDASKAAELLKVYVKNMHNIQL